MRLSAPSSALPIDSSQYELLLRFSRLRRLGISKSTLSKFRISKPSVVVRRSNFIFFFSKKQYYHVDFKFDILRLTYLAVAIAIQNAPLQTLEAFSLSALFALVTWGCCCHTPASAPKGGVSCVPCPFVCALSLPSDDADAKTPNPNPFATPRWRQQKVVVSRSPAAEKLTSA